VRLPPEFIELCTSDGTTPDEVLRGFVADLCSLDGTHGSDERDLVRCGYPYLS
jgi:hypothetical protein